MRYTELRYLRGVTTRELGGDVLYIKDNNDTLTIGRNWLSLPCVKDMDGLWNKLERQEALDEYENTTTSLK